MSKRLVLLSGTPRAGTTTLAAAAAREAAQHGYRTSLVALESIPVEDVRREAWPHLAELLALLVPAFDGTARDSSDVAVLPGVDQLLVLREIAKRASVDADIVVVDAGQVERLIEAVSWLETVDGFIEAIHLPQAVEGSPRTHELLTTVRAELAGIRAVLFDAQTTVRLVTTPDDAHDAAQAVAGLSLAGLHVDGIIINRVPKRKDGWPKAWTAEQRAKARSAVDSFGTLPVARVRLRADRITVSLARHFGLDTAWTPPPIAAVESVGDGYRWTVPLTDPLAQPTRVGYRADAVYVEVGRYRRRFAMPSVVRRCTITEAQLGPRSLTLVCQPNPQVWPS